MSNPFITLWSQAQVEVERRERRGDRELRHTANDQFRDVRVQPGDRVYIVATKGGRLMLLSCLVVHRVTDKTEAQREFPYELYDARDHLIGSGAPLDPDREIPEDVVRQLVRASGKPIRIADDEYRVNVHSLRRTGRLTEHSADLLDSVLRGSSNK
ncbi:hypothetical protein LRS13_07685 [Svornostia abyssi]|uniref:Uncharacterized protein n=1 Tax=Svornostia abyssi TaxID=2898438 RepID=A0ABY5PL40_9ACTN|nr:hypothetical protein LRS13_07685 [Parviterribacteraceae bacterium J379]